MRFKVLWIDDEYEKQLDLIGDAEQDGIDIFPFKSSEEGMAELERDLYKFHAVILDAKVKKQKGDNVSGLAGLAASRDRLIEINREVYLPYFIFTGQPDYMTNEMFRESYGDYYIKGTDNQRLFDSIREKVENKTEYIIQRDYYEAFEICDTYFDRDIKKTLLNILSSVKQPLQKFDDELYFTQIRIVLESIFRVANKFGLLHDNCIVGGKVNLSESSLFLSGEATKHSNVNVKCAKRHFPRIISDATRNILFITGAASHTIDPDLKNNLNLQEYRAFTNSPYMLYSLTYQLLDILMWFRNYVSQNPDPEENKKLWVDEVKPDGGWISGKVVRIADNGFGTFQPDTGGATISIIPYKVKEYGLVLEQPIEVVIKIEGNKNLIQEIRILN